MAYAAAVSQSFIIGLSFMFVKKGLQAADPADFMAWRFAAAFAAASLPVAAGLVRPRLTLRDAASILPVALFYPILFFSLQTLSMKHLASSEAGIIQSTAPIFTMILAGIFLGERAAAAQKLCLFATVAGVAFISFMRGAAGGSHQPAGVLLALGSTLAFACYNVLTRGKLRRHSVFELTYLMTGMAFAAFAAVSVAGHALRGSLGDLLTPLRNRDFLIAVLYLGIPSSLFTALLANFALSRLEAYKISVFNSLSTVVAMTAGWLFLNERLFWYHVVGAAVIVIGVFGTRYTARGMRAKAGDTKTT